MGHVYRYSKLLVALNKTWDKAFETVRNYLLACKHKSTDAVDASCSAAQSLVLN